MGEERKRILKMLAEGKITSSEAEELLDALGKGRDRRSARPKTRKTSGISTSRY